MINRRDFLKKSLVGAAGLSLTGGLSLDALAAPGEVTITILHTNDMHSRIEPFPASHSRHAGMAGMARRATLVEQIRKEQEHVLLLDAGDIFQGTPYFNFFGGELEFKLMSRMGYDAATLGNHDFDSGLEGLHKQLPHAKFPFLSANYDFSKTILKDRFEPYKIFNKGGVKIGVFGIGIELQGLVPDRLFGNTVHHDPVDVAKRTVQKLKAEKCELIICLSHLGYQYDNDKISDLKLAEKVSGIDLIIGGHTHTFLDKPTVVKDAAGHKTLVNQVGWAGINLGRVDFNIPRKRKKKTATSDLVRVS